MPTKQLLIITMLISILTIGPFHTEYHAAKSMNNCDQTTLELTEQIAKMETKEEIKNTLGNDYKEVIGEMYNNQVWRFDICSNSDYHNDATIDSVDIEGLKSGKLKKVLFLSFSEDKQTIMNKSLYYTDSQNNIHVVTFIGEKAQDEIIYMGTE